MKKTFLFLLFFLPVLAMYAQSKKELKELGITGRKEETRKSGQPAYAESSETYDANGNTIEKIEYDSKGDITFYEKYEYNEKGKLQKELQIDPVSKKPKKTIEYIYENGEVQKEIHRDKKDAVIKTVEYRYEGVLKMEKKIMDAKGNLTETKTYTYTKKNGAE